MLIRPNLARLVHSRNAGAGDRLNARWPGHQLAHEPDENGPGNLYRFKVFAARRKPRKPIPNLQYSEQSNIDRTLRMDWMIHKFAWCITCWAEIEDVDQLEEPDWTDLLGL